MNTLTRIVAVIQRPMIGDVADWVALADANAGEVGPRPPGARWNDVEGHMVLAWSRDLAGQGLEEAHAEDLAIDRMNTWRGTIDGTVRAAGYEHALEALESYQQARADQFIAS